MPEAPSRSSRGHRVCCRSTSRGRRAAEGLAPTRRRVPGAVCCQQEVPRRCRRPSPAPPRRCHRPWATCARAAEAGAPCRRRRHRQPWQRWMRPRWPQEEWQAFPAMGPPRPIAARTWRRPWVQVTSRQSARRRVRRFRPWSVGTVRSTRIATGSCCCCAAVAWMQPEDSARIRYCSLVLVLFFLHRRLAWLLHWHLGRGLAMLPSRPVVRTIFCWAKRIQLF
mmetsp:Transcript_116524/g.370622  ORF Transcript_116524/g.370622 Transcript_116524/m.370622 type:complete len:223 (-) Transcript_116524:1127-1795(-)